MPKEIIIRCSGPNTQPRFNVNAAGDELQIEVVNLGESSGMVIFTGENFSREDFEAGGGKKSEDDFFAIYKK